MSVYLRFICAYDKIKCLSFVEAVDFERLRTLAPEPCRSVKGDEVESYRKFGGCSSVLLHAYVEANMRVTSKQILNKSANK